MASPKENWHGLKYALYIYFWPHNFKISVFLIFLRFRFNKKQKGFSLFISLNIIFVISLPDWRPTLPLEIMIWTAWIYTAWSCLQHHASYVISGQMVLEKIFKDFYLEKIYIFLCINLTPIPSYPGDYDINKLNVHYLKMPQKLLLFEPYDVWEEVWRSFSIYSYVNIWPYCG